MATPHEQVRARILEVEAELRDSFVQDCSIELGLVDDASSLLSTVMLAIGDRQGGLGVDKAGVPSGDIATLKLIALQFIGVRALRVVRAARAALSTGYEPECRALDRILVELVEHRRAILDDASGKTALDWLKGKRRQGIAGRVAAMTPPDLYKKLSRDSHGDPEPVIRLVNAANGTLSTGPSRTPATRASLLMYAGFCRDQAVVIAKAGGIALGSLQQLDGAITAGWASLETQGG